MPGRDAGDAGGGVACACTAPRQPITRRGQGGDPEVVGVFLLPFNPGFGAINPQAQAVFLACGDLGTPQHPARARAVAQQDMGVVIDTPAGDKALQVGGELGKRQARDEIGEVEGMGADIACRTTRTRARRIGAPIGLFVVDLMRQPILGVFNLHQPNIAQIAGLHHGFGLADHRIASVVVGQGKHYARGFGGFGQLFRLRQRRGQRFVADHMDAAFEKL